MSKLNIVRLGFLIALFNLLVFQVLAQNTLGQVNIASPNASSLGKYGDIPVSYHTGVPNISLPIYTVSSGSLKLPISLSYHAAGLKVEESDSWVGAGWTLNAGGAITRTVKDKPDEKQTNSSQQLYGHYSDYGIANYWQSSIASGSDPNVDNEPDLFFFNFNGYSGKFWFNDDRTPVIMPEQDFKIECSYTPGLWNTSPGVNGGSGRCLDAFIITTNDGTKYYFGSTDPLNPLTGTYCDPIEVSSVVTPQSGTTTSQVISSWFLRKIVSVDGNFSINLNYTRDKFAFYTFNNPSTGSLNGGGQVFSYNLVKNLMAGVRLSNVTTDNAKVDFTDGIIRQDLSRWRYPATDQGMTDYINETVTSLGSIIISDNQANCNKKYLFSYDYFIDNTTPVISNFSGIISDKKRLKLLSLQEQACDGTMSVPPYNFTYFTEQVPRKFSFSRDHWGYNNGITTNTTLYPALSINNAVFNNSDKAERGSAWPAMRAGTLNKITYPTGGYTSFDFEANTFTIIVPVSADQMVGGLRIKAISNDDPVSGQTTLTNYSYLSQGSNLSSGVLYGKPTYIQLFRNDMVKKTNFLGNAAGNGCWTIHSANVIEDQGYIFSDNPVRPMATTQGSHIGYGEVKVSQTNNGFSIYRFSVTPPWLIDRNNLAITNIITPAACDISIPNYPAAPLPNDFYRGGPTYEGHFNESGLIIKEKQFLVSYLDNPVTTMGRLSYTISPDGAGPFKLTTFYELKTARKTEADVIERTYQPGGVVIEKQTQTFYESIYHHQPTKIITTDSKGKSIEQRIKYAFDYRVPVFENTPNCLTAAASFLDYANSLYTSTYASQYLGCPGYTSPCWGTIETNYWTTVFNARKSYIDCRKTNYTNTIPLNTFQVNHNTAKSAADAELKPILWMQDAYMNPSIEISEWKNNNLLGANYTVYNNLRDDGYGIYPSKTMKIDLAAAAPTFSISTVAANNTSISKDSRYKDLSQLDFNKGNVIGSLGRDGITGSYDWGYNQSLPIVKIVNASNKFKESVQPAVLSQTWNFYIGSSSNSGTLNTNFYHTQTGSITLSIPSGLPSNAQATANFSLTGPLNKSGYLCAAGFGGASCTTTPNSLTFTNMPAGQYNLTATVSTSFPSYTFGYSLSYTYNGLAILSSGLKEFFYDGFEESTNGNVITGFSHSGKKYCNASYTNSFIPPNSRNYIIQWWNLISGQWVLNSMPYTANMVLAGPVDDVRIFPKDAQINTYTYDPLIGLTSQTNPGGKTTYYDYDKMGRLKNIRDNKRNITKNFLYNYGLAPTSLPALINFSANNTTAVAFDVQLSSKTSGQVFSYVANAATTTSTGNIPPDIYDVYISRKTGAASYLFGLCTFSASGGSTTFYNVQVAAGACNNIIIN